jgi:hypothetical protein
MVLKYGFLDEPDTEETDEFGEPKTPEYTISEKPVEPLNIEDPTNQEDQDRQDAEANNAKDITDPSEEEEPDDGIVVDPAEDELNEEDQDEDTKPLFEFIKEKCTLNELFYKRKVANIIHKLLQTNPKGLVKEQLVSLEYWYRKLLFLVDIPSTKRFLKSVLKDYKKTHQH